MPVMAKKSTHKPTPMPEPAPAPEPRPDRHKDPVMGFRPDPALRAVIEALARRERRSVSKQLSILVEAALTALGQWPPPPKPDAN